VCAHAGDIDLQEFQQLVYDGLLLEGAVQDYEAAFNAVDDSGNGTIGAHTHWRLHACQLVLTEHAVVCC
jgi:hypothetical protein